MAPLRPTLPSVPSDEGWIVSPWFDCLFLANVAWLVLLLPGFATAADTPVDFWQIYFLTLPHRWLTLVLVVADGDRREGMHRKLVTVALVATAVVAGVWFGTGALTCLAVADFLWNGWHFASQHAGVLRMYSRKVGGGWPWLERWGMRIFVTYAAIRTAGWATGWIEAEATYHLWLHIVDAAVLVVPALMIGVALAGRSRARVGKLAYLFSVCLLYSGLVVSLSFGIRSLIVPLATASSMFHAVEYLAVVTHYARRRRNHGSAGAFRAMAANWLAFLTGYVVLLGAVGVTLDGAGPAVAEAWAAANLWMAFIHYAYDGMIWKLRKPATAAALGVG